MSAATPEPLARLHHQRSTIVQSFLWILLAVVAGTSAINAILLGPRVLAPTAIGPNVAFALLIGTALWLNRREHFRTDVGLIAAATLLAASLPLFLVGIDGHEIGLFLFAVPLVAKGQLQGVLEIFHRSPLDPSDDWNAFLTTLATQAAIAVDSTNMFRDLERSNTELRIAYDTTIEGWARALDLKDEETEGHSRRVTELTVRLAERMGMADEELVHVRRGALLHDIGKIGVPDAILLKPGKLDAEEWEIMNRHTTYAVDLLAPIPFLRPALDIPRSHHEKWDGSGYPRGLQGEQIPLAARLFAVVDVYDALTSDRPYRAAWSPERALDHIREGAGTHVDLEVVKAFLEFEAGEEG